MSARQRAAESRSTEDAPRIPDSQRRRYRRAGRGHRVRSCTGQRWHARTRTKPSSRPPSCMAATPPISRSCQAEYEKDPNSVDAEWRAFFEALKDNGQDVAKSARGASWKRPNWPVPVNGELVSALDGNWAAVERAVGDRIKAQASDSGAEIGRSPDPAGDPRFGPRPDADPRLPHARPSSRQSRSAGLEPRHDDEELHPSHYGFTDADCDRRIFLDNVLGLEFGTIREILAHPGADLLPDARRRVHAHLGPDREGLAPGADRRAGQGDHLHPRGQARDPATSSSRLRASRSSSTSNTPAPSASASTAAKSLIPALEQIIKRGGNLGVKEIVLGMAHRGRLNVLTQVMAKPHRAMFHEFKGGSFAPDEVEGSGDVKYHLGASSDRAFDGNSVHLSLTANPSHLEIVDPVVLGKVRAKQDQFGDPPERRYLGDAAPDPWRRRLRRPGRRRRVLRPLGPEGPPHRRLGALHRQQPDRLHHQSALLALLALSVRRRQDGRGADLPRATATTRRRSSSPPRSRPSSASSFQKPVVIDMFCYRRFGHNEGDEPAFTQPMMYRLIRQHPSTLEIYAEKLARRGRHHRGRGRGDEGRLAGAARGASSRSARATSRTRPTGSTAAGPASRPSARTSTTRAAARPALPAETLKEIGSRITEVPQDFNAPSHHPPLPRQPPQDDRDAARASTGRPPRPSPSARCSTRAIRVRLSGQDVERGTFSQRHSVLIDQETEARYTPLNHIRDAAAAGAQPTRSSTRCCRRRRCSASSTATRSPSRTRSCSGRRSSATSPTAPRSCSTSSSRRASASGCACRPSSASCRTATRGRGRSTPRPASSASCRCAPRTTCRSRTARRRRTTSTSCAGS